MIRIEAATVIHSSPETVWRHLTRVGEWPRWYPGLHGVDATDPIVEKGATWRASGQIGRMLYRSNNVVSRYRLLNELEIRGDRRPWIAHQTITFTLDRHGHNCELTVRMAAVPGFGFVGRLMLTRSLRGRLQREAQEICNRLSEYLGRALPHH